MTSATPGAGNLDSFRPQPQPPAPMDRGEARLVSRALRGVWRVLVGLWKYIVGVAFCSTGPVAAIVVLGWIYRVMQRSAYRYWHRIGAAKESGETFNAFCHARSEMRPLAHWPNWFVRHDAIVTVRETMDERGLGRAILSALSVPVHSLWLNFKRGVGAIAATWVLTLPACALWQFSWYAGWNNSFFKLYEHAWVGPTTGIAGIVLFIAAMLYVPTAQARHATSGNWRAFFDFRIVWRVIQLQWWRCTATALLYALLSIPVMILMMWPIAFESTRPDFYELTDAELAQLVNEHYFAACLLVFPVILFLKWFATRVYAAGIVKAIAGGGIEIDSLREEDREALGAFGLLARRQVQPRNIVVKSAFWTARRAGRAMALVSSALLWFVFVAQIYVAIFFNNQLAQGWLNQPLVQLPWFKYMPAHLAGF